MIVSESVVPESSADLVAEQTDAEMKLHVTQLAILEQQLVDSGMLAGTEVLALEQVAVWQVGNRDAGLLQLQVERVAAGHPGLGLQLVAAQAGGHSGVQHVAVDQQPLAGAAALAGTVEQQILQVVAGDNVLWLLRQERVAAVDPGLGLHLVAAQAGVHSDAHHVVVVQPRLAWAAALH